MAGQPAGTNHSRGQEEVLRSKVSPTDRLYLWTGGGLGTSWSEAKNWCSGIGPGAGDVVIVGNFGPGTDKEDTPPEPPIVPAPQRRR
jgi:hypothetical protein